MMLPTEPRHVKKLIHTLLPCLAVLLAGSAALAQRASEKHQDLEGIEIQENLGDDIPTDLTFTDSSGQTVRLGDYFQDGKPVVLNMVYYECPMLCTFALNGLLDVLKETDWTPGEEFNVVTVSFNPEEGPELSEPKKNNYIESLDRPEAAGGWAFLTGDKENVEALAETVGFTYEWVEEQQDYAHATALMIATPEGKLSRYLHGVFYDPKTLRLSLIEASGGEIGSITENAVLQYCLLYDPDKGEYGPAAMKIMRAGGALTIGAVVAALVFFHLYERRRKPSTPSTP